MDTTEVQQLAFPRFSVAQQAETVTTISPMGIRQKIIDSLEPLPVRAVEVYTDS
jgi:hypothetical protein